MTGSGAGGGVTTEAEADAETEGSARWTGWCRHSTRRRRTRRRPRRSTGTRTVRGPQPDRCRRHGSRTRRPRRRRRRGAGPVLPRATPSTGAVHPSAGGPGPRARRRSPCRRWCRTRDRGAGRRRSAHNPAAAGVAQRRVPLESPSSAPWSRAQIPQTHTRCRSGGRSPARRRTSRTSRPSLQRRSRRRTASGPAQARASACRSWCRSAAWRRSRHHTRRTGNGSSFTGPSFGAVQQGSRVSVGHAGQ